MPSTPLPSDIRRAGYAEESGGIYGSAGSIVDVGLLIDPSATITADIVEREIAGNSQRDNAAPLMGSQTGEAAFSAHVSGAVKAQLGPLILAAMGAETAASALTFGSHSTNVSATASAGTPNRVVELTEQTTGFKHYRPGTVSGSTITFTIKPPASLTFTDVRNASETSGAEYVADASLDAPTTFQVLIDQAGHSGERVARLTGAAVSSCKLSLAMGEPPKLAFSFMSGRGEYVSGSSGLGDPSVSDVAFHAHHASLFLQDPSTPAVGTERNLVAFETEIAHAISMRRAAQGVTAGALPLSNVVGILRAAPVSNDITATIEDGDLKAWQDLRDARTPLELFLTLFSGNTGAASGANAITYDVPEVRVVSAEPAEVDGREAVALVLRKIRKAGLKKEYLDIFGG